MTPDPWAVALAPTVASLAIASLKALRPKWLPKRGRRRQAALGLAGLAGSALVTFGAAWFQGIALGAASVAELAAQALVLTWAAMGVYAQAKGHQAPATFPR